MIRSWTSFRTRLIIGAAVWIIAGLAVSGFALSELFRAHVTQQFDDELHGHAVELVNLSGVEPNGQPYLHRRLSDPRFIPRGSGFYWTIIAADGRVLNSDSMDGKRLVLTGGPPPVGRERHAFMQGPTGPLRLVETAAQPPGATRPLHIGIGVDERLLDQVLFKFNWTLFLSMAAIAVGLIAAAVLQIWFGLRPLGRVREALAAVRSGKASRLPADLPSEVRPLAGDLNALLEANLEMLRRARAQAGNLGHALKTPLAILTDEAERLKNAGQPKAAEVVLQQCERMRRQIDYQIARARAAALRSAPGVASDVAETLEPIVSAMRRLHGRRGVDFEVRAPDGLLAAVDAQDLGEIVANLLDNAGKWAASRVSISAASVADSRLSIRVEEDGPGLDPESFELVFGIGQRLDEQTPGHGLGLPIVRDLVTLYGGRIWLEASPLGGVCARVELPSVTG